MVPEMFLGRALGVPRASLIYPKRASVFAEKGCGALLLNPPNERSVVAGDT